MKLFTRYIGTILIVMILFPAALYAAPAAATQYFFDKKPFVPPRIIEDLSPWISDKGEQVVAINLMESVAANRYFGDIKTTGTYRPFVFYEKDCEAPCTMGPPRFGYRLIGTTPTGITALFTESSGEGSGAFRSIVLVTLEKDKGLSLDKNNRTLTLDRPRWLIKKLGEIPLGDRYDGKITLHGATLKIGKDENPHSAGIFTKETVITFQPGNYPVHDQ